MFYQEYKDRAAFMFVYIREAHPSDEWQMPSNEKDGVVLTQPVTHDERRSTAGRCCSQMKLTMPCVVDTLDNTVDDAYAAWPERIFVIDEEGVVGYASKQGPWGFDPQQAQEWLDRYFRECTKSRRAM